MATNLYALLGLHPTSSPELLQAAYQYTASQLHPEREPQGQALRDLQSAYALLASPARRQAYDEQSALPTSREPRRRAEPLKPRPVAEKASNPHQEPPSTDLLLRESVGEVHPSFEELFERLWSNFSLLTRPKAERLESLTIEVPLTREEAASGGATRILIPARAQCPTCQGQGAVGTYECWRCQGHGAITADYPIDIPFPAGIRNEYDTQVSLAQFGIGNFYLTVRFRVKGE